MLQEAPTFEEIDNHVQAADMASISLGGKHHMTQAAAQANPATVLPNVCAAYKIVRPILKGVVAIPFLPKKWKDALNAFLAFMDALCP
ncbi:MAG: hypothetical protein M3Z54_02550 [Gemmatimonadota bacterium]|nr:hypothetical protein [Gemmatimonadota bacterium]